LMVSALKQLKTSMRDTHVGRVSKKSSMANQQRNSKQRIDSKSTRRTMATDRRNPFEHKFTRVKHPVLGQRLKGVTGHQGMAKKRGQVDTYLIYGHS
jgi:hypothetical protein